jgi:hypothetical protein
MRGMSNERYRMALVRLRTRIDEGLKLNADDSNQPGAKYTECTWGLCSGEKEQWPNAGDHIFPVDFMDRGRVAPERRDHQTCPMQTNSENGSPSGCFYKCRVFSRRLETPNREQVLELFDKRIDEVGPLPSVCACDGTGEVIDPVGRDKKLPCPDCKPEQYVAWRAQYSVVDELAKVGGRHVSTKPATA